LTPAFAQLEDKQAQWSAFARRSSAEGMPGNLADAIEGIAGFLMPILEHLVAGEPVPRTWKAAGPWRM